MADEDDNLTGVPKVVKRMLKNYKLADAAENNNRQRAIYAMKFRRGGDDQWDTTMLDVRKQGNRPSETYNQIPQFLHQVTNDMRMNMPQTRFVAGNEGSVEVAEIFEDLVRNIQTSSEGEVAYDNAADSQVTIGWGYWRYITEYENDKTFDQVIKVKWVPNSLMVYDDPLCTQQDYSDRRFLIEVFDIPKEDVKHQGDAKRDYGKDDLDEIGDTAPHWATDETVRVAEYWEVTDKKSKLYRQNGKITDKKPAGESEERDVIIPVVKWYKCTALEVLEEKEWPGLHIPYVRVAGETQVIDGEIVYSGLVEGMIAPQRMYNYWSNTATEIMGMAPLSPWIAAVGQIEGFESIWAQSNVRKTAYLPYNPKDINGTMLPPPQRNSASADVSGAMAMIQQAQQNFYATTGIYPASLGQASNEKSGKAILARQREGDTSTYHFSDNMARGFRYGGRILADLIPRIYDGSRMIDLTKEDKSTRRVKINQKYKDEDGQVKEYNLTVGSYDVMVSTGPSYTTKRQEEAESMLQLAQSTDLMEVAPDIFYKTQDFAGSQDLSERYKKKLMLTAPSLVEEDKPDELPPQVLQKMQMDEQAIEQLGGQLQQLEQALQDKQADIANKEADYQLKQQQLQVSGVSDQMKAENDRLKIELDFQKLQLQREQMQFDQANALHQQVQQQFETNYTEPMGEDMQRLPPKEQLQAMLSQHEQMEQDEAMKKQAEEQRMMQEQYDREQKEARDAALLQGISDIAQMLQVLTASINAPKTVVRDENGMVQGVITGTMQ